MKLAVAGALALVVVLGTAARRPPAAPAPTPASPIEPLALATRIVERDPALVVLDLRDERARAAEKPIPGAVLVAADSETLGALADAVPGRTTVVVYDATGARHDVLGAWPAGLRYRYLAGGRAAWTREVLTPAAAASASLAERERVERQNQLAAYFSGAAVKASSAAPPPPVAGGGGAPKKKKAGGC